MALYDNNMGGNMPMYGSNGNAGLSIADALAIGRDNSCGNGGFFGGDSGWVLFLFFLLAWGNGGFGGFGGGYNGMGNAWAQGALTRAEMYDGFATQNVQNAVNGVANGLCDGFYALNTSILSGVGDIQNTLCNGFNGVNTNISASTNSINQGICDLGYSLKDCCCQTQSAIQGVNYNNAKNTCDIITAGTMNTRDIIDSQNSGFQRVIDFLTNDKIEGLRSELQAAQLQLGNLSQTNTIINTLRPIPQPAYLTCSPYASAAYGCVGNLANNNCCYGF